ncbi:MAG: 4Fe-4S dicluster domain-containing protein [Acidobacteria bacterium]|nr:4Fe-4S dicluster domain-containing protein [Acidobacteriota bacterium]
MVESNSEAPLLKDLDKCVHCGLCLNSCPTYRELGVEMDSPRGRIYQMVQVVEGRAAMTEDYLEHMDLCLACRGCESACPSGVQYGRLIEAARAHIEQNVKRPWHIEAFRDFVFGTLLQSRFLLSLAGRGLHLFQASGLQSWVRRSGLLKRFGNLENIEMLSPPAEAPFFFSQLGKVFPAEGGRKHKVAFLSGCIANVSFARLNEATVRVLQKNGCEVHIPAQQNCCGALHVHAGRKDDARELAKNNIDATLDGGYDAILTNAAGCGSTLKEYDELLEHDTAYRDKSIAFKAKMKDINEFLASIEIRPPAKPLQMTVTYQDSCHLCHGQKVRAQPRKVLQAIPGVTLKEMALSDLCCGSAGIYNVVHNDIAMSLLEKKMKSVNATGAECIVTANPGCMIQLQAGARIHGKGQPVLHVVEVLDKAYRG